MKRTLLFFGFSLLAYVNFCLSTSTFAGPNEDMIKNLYTTGTGPAAAENFSEQYYSDGTFVEPRINTCVIIDSGDQPYNYKLSREIRITPAYGPLVPAKREEKLVFGDTQLSYIEFAPPTVANLDLVLVNPIYRTWINGNSGVQNFVPASLYARKSGTYLAFKVEIQYNSSSIQDELYYGYCYPSGKALF